MEIESIELRRTPVRRFLSPLLRRTLTPGIFQWIRFRWWSCSSYYPRLVTSRLHHQMPEVHSFGVSSELRERLQSVNLLIPTKMCRVMTKWGSDKGRANRYTAVYSALFQERFDHPLRIFELGLGSNNLNMLSNMGRFGIPGASLRGWRQLFPNATVYGADIDRRILFQEDRIETFYCDQLDRSLIRRLWMHPEFDDGLDIIIDDGLHTFEANVSFLEESLDHLRPGGIYITEDISWRCFERWFDRLETIYSKQYPSYEFEFLVLAQRGYNNLLLVRRT